MEKATSLGETCRVTIVRGFQGKTFARKVISPDGENITRLLSKDPLSFCHCLEKRHTHRLRCMADPLLELWKSNPADCIVH